MVKTKSLDEAKRRYSGSTSVVTDRYRAGVQAADWKTKASSSSAEELWKQKLQDAMSKNRRQKGIERVSNEEWRTKAINKGAGRIAEGMRQGADDWAREFAPYHSALQSLDLPDRVADPMQNVTNRVGAVVKAMVDKKRELLGE